MDNLPNIEEVMDKIENIQGDWDGSCKCTDCYWNMWNPHPLYKNEASKVCVSESLSDTVMTPNSKECKSYWSYEIACGCKKGE